jgi:NAD(P)-dependent dehydrogenase (short-subunit alcohol dehydrogenase family)
MLDGSSSQLAHQAQNAALLFLSLAFLPLDTFILFASLIWRAILPNQVEHRRRHARQEHGFHPRTILVTGVGMTKGLVLARLFYQAGHDVVGADFEPDGARVCGKVSRAVKKFYSLEMPTRKRDIAASGSSSSSFSPDIYIQQLLDIVTREKVDLWVSCSGVASAIEDGMAKEVLESRTHCKAIQFDVRTTQRLHEKHSFIKHTRDDVGLRVPETHEITSRAVAERILRDSITSAAAATGRKKYIMKPIGVDDAARADMTLLPRASEVDTAKHLARLQISQQSPWILQQYIRGREYCTHSLVVNGRVKAFVACPSAELLMHYEALPFESPLSQAMLEFTRRYAARSSPGGERQEQEQGKAFTGHLSFDFMVKEEEEAQSPESIMLYPIECNPRAHTAVTLFDGTTEMVEAYLSALEPDSSDDSKGHSNSNNNNTGTTPDPSPSRLMIYPSHQTDNKYFWAGHDLVTLVIMPTLSLLLTLASISTTLQSYAIFLTHLLTWKDGTYQLWDPCPWWWLYHVYWPMRFWVCLVQGKRWSRLNVSTTKMFEC